jgi:sigma-54 specific flagellar transcriptional regulator A
VRQDAAKVQGMLATDKTSQEFPVGRSGAIHGLDQLMRQVAKYDSTVLIRGESGCGKELVARRIHELSARSNGPFVPVNCGAIPRELLESELFGHEKGAFTGALTTRIGRFELADGGTLFLDEIGDMSFDMQVKLLRVLQERAFERVGSGEQRRANVRILAATHRDLETRARAGEFREDLFFRLNVFPIVVPSLRDRLDDLPALIDDLVRRGEAEGRPSISFTETALDCLSAYAWPGNVRELQNLIERLAILYPDQTIDREQLPVPIGERRRNVQPAVTTIPKSGLDLREYLGNIEKQLIRSALDQTDGTVAHAARLLKLQRTTLVEKLRKYELHAHA